MTAGRKKNVELAETKYDYIDLSLGKLNNHNFKNVRFKDVDLENIVKIIFPLKSDKEVKVLVNKIFGYLSELR